MRKGGAMKTRYFSLVLVGHTCLTAVMGCATPPKAPTKSKDIAVRVGRLFPKAKNLKASILSVRLEMYNPRSSAIVVKGVDYEIDTGDISGVVKGTSDAGVSLESDQKAELAFEASIPLPEDPEQYRSVLKKGNIDLNVKGVVRFEDGSTASFERKGAVATPTLPKFVVHDAQAARYGKAGVDVTIFLRLINENVFPVLIESVEYTVSINDKKMGTEQGAVGERLVQGAAQEFEFNAVLDESSYENIKELLASGELTYAVQATVNVGQLEMPYDYNGSIKLAAGE